jgi:hypothetical protein
MGFLILVASIWSQVIIKSIWKYGCGKDDHEDKIWFLRVPGHVVWDVYILQLPTMLVTDSTFHVSKLKPIHEDKKRKDKK